MTTRLASAVQKSSPALSAGELTPLPTALQFPGTLMNIFCRLQITRQHTFFLVSGAPSLTLQLGHVGVCLWGSPHARRQVIAAPGDKKPFASTFLKLLKLGAVRSKPPAPCIHPCSGQLHISQHGTSDICMLMSRSGHQPLLPHSSCEHQRPLRKTLAFSFLLCLYLS